MKWYEYILDRLDEPTTYAGIFGILAAVFGVVIKPELANAVMSAGAAAASLALIILKEK